LAEKRWKKRHRKRYSVRFGTAEPNRVAFSDDINHGGLFIRTAVVANPGVKLHVEVDLPQGLVAFKGEVRWAKRVPSNFLHKLKGGMGVMINTFLEGEEIYRAVCDELVEQRGA
jgi:hypothetical protein